IGITGASVTPGTLAPGATGTIADVTYVLTPADIAAGSVTNTAIASGDAVDPNGDPLGTVSDDSDDPNDPTNVDPDGDGDADDPTVTTLDGTGLLTGTVFEDTNGNGVQDAGEPGIAGVDVVVTDSNGLPQTVTTDANGAWSAVVPAGDTTSDIDETSLPAGVDIQTAGTDPTTTTVGAGATVSEPADGFFAAVPNLALEKTSGGVVDANMNGITDAGDTITYSFLVTNNGNVTVNNLVIDDAVIGITGASVTPSTLAPGATGTIADVTYVLTPADIAAGSVTNTAIASGDAVDPNGDPLGTVSDDSDDPNDPTNVDPDGDGDADDPTVTTLTPTGRVLGTVFNDANGNGVQDPGEAGLGGVSVDIVDSNGNPQTVVTAADGSWTAQVPAGDTDIDVDETTLPAGSALTTVGSDPETVTVVAGTDTSSTDDGYTVPTLDGTVSGVVFNDANGNGVQDPGEAGLGGVSVDIVDSNGNPQTVVTAADGSWTAQVPAGDTDIDVDETTLPAGSALTTAGSDPETVTAVAGTDTPSTDDGYTVPTLDGTVSGVVFNDANGNGVQDPGEAGLGGVSVDIVDSNGNP
ncbi:beta strand repeat-containing protein, partial [Nonlabens xiamenensis]|uniref:beta strand repeat-containing protein n=1 Tax=Nonlabens xiamenensis TaxID=2341043 RepID=UPI0029390570